MRGSWQPGELFFSEDSINSYNFSNNRTNTRERRRHRRISLRTQCHLTFSNPSSELKPVIDLSLGGLYVKNSDGIKAEENCVAEFSEIGWNISNFFNFKAKTVRVDQVGAHLKFVDMTNKDYMILQTILLYNSDSPTSIAQGFTEKFY